MLVSRRTVCVTYRTVSVTSTISSRTARISLPLFAFSRRKIAKVCDMIRKSIRFTKCLWRGRILFPLSVNTILAHPTRFVLVMWTLCELVLLLPTGGNT